MKGLKVLAVCSVLILLTSSQCGKVANGMMRLQEIEFELQYLPKEMKAIFDIEINYPAYMTKGRVDSILFFLNIDDQKGHPIGVLTDTEPTSPKNQYKSVSSQYKFNIPQDKDTSHIYYYTRLYINGSYREEGGFQLTHILKEGNQ